MTNKVNFEFSATDSGLAREINKINNSVERLGDKMFGMQDRFNKAFGSLKNIGGNADFGNQLRQIAGMTAGLVSFNSLLQRGIEAGRQFGQEGLEASKKWDQVFREFAGQSNLRGGPLKQATERILKIAQETSLPVEQVGRMATQMVSSGYSTDDASGGALREQAKALLATNIAGKEGTNPEEIVRATASYLAAQGMEKNEQNVRDVSMRVAALYKSSEMQFSDFMEFARESVGMRGVVDIGTQLSSLSTLVDVMPAAEAATGLRNVAGRLRTVRGTPEKVEGLKMLGLKPEEVDLIGEDFITALKRMSEGVKKAKPEDVPVALKKVFEEKGVTMGTHLLNSIDLIIRRIGEQTGEAVNEQYKKDVAFAAQGVNATTRRQESAKLELMAKSGKDRDEVMFAEAYQYMLERGELPALASGNIGIARSLSYLTGVSSDFSLSTVLEDDKDLQAIQRRVFAKDQNQNLDPEAIRRNVFEPSRVLDFGGAQVATWEEARKRFRNPNSTYRNTTFNPWYDMARRFPQEVAAQRDAARLENEMSARIDAFGELSPEEAKRFGGASDALQTRANKLDRNVHSYDLQQVLNRVADALDRNTAATKGNTDANSEAGGGERRVHRPTTINQQRPPVGGGAL